MKSKLIMVWCLAIIACRHSKVVLTQSSSQQNLIQAGKSYRVYKIDSINSYYLIYAERNDSLYKIVSKKPSVPEFSIVAVKGVYEFKLISRWAKKTTNGMEILPQNALLVSCVAYDDSTTICLERDSINDLHSAENLRGLSFIKK